MNDYAKTSPNSTEQLPAAQQGKEQGKEHDNVLGNMLSKIPDLLLRSAKHNFLLLTEKLGLTYSNAEKSSHSPLNAPSIDKNDKSQSDDCQPNQSAITQYKQDILHSFAFSDFIARIALQYPQDFIALLPRLCQQSVFTLDTHVSIANELMPDFSQMEDEQQASQAIRKFRHLTMLCIAWCDFHKKQSTETSLLATSKIANQIICTAYQYVHRSLAPRFGQPQKNQQLLILAMGKLGGEELNFSSDIDLIFTYPATGYTEGGRKQVEHQVFFTKVAQKLIQMLDNITQYGQVYRVDMRLRPLGDSGPLVLPFSAFESYYLEQGRQWERFAMQKMRIVNSTPHNQELYDIIRPFVYRKYIDYTTIESIREMKLMIEKEVRRRQISDNIKLGKGGIREVEFFVQSLQLIHAGRNPECQISSILKAMQALEQADLLSKDDHKQLKRDYLLLRQTEQYLQAFNDQQTQTLPMSRQQAEDYTPSSTIKQGDDQARTYKDHLRLKLLLDETAQDAPQSQTYFEQIHRCMHNINQIFHGIIQDANTQNQSETDQSKSQFYDDLWLVTLSQDEFASELAVLVDETSSGLLFDCITSFRKKVERSGVSARAIKSINRLIPLLLSEFEVYEKSFSADQIEAVFTLLSTISGRVTYIDLLLENPEVRARLLLLCKKSLWISQQISQYPLLLDELLHPLYLDKNDISLNQWQQDCADDLRQTLLRINVDDVELVMDTLRSFKHANQLRIAAADISGTLAINQVSDKLTLLAEVIMQQVIEYAWQHTVHRFGLPQTERKNGQDFEPANNSKHFALVAYGKFGGIELSYGSDLDVVFLHDADLSLSTDTSGTSKQLSNQEFYIKLVQRISLLCTTKTYSGILYDIDLRLRPSGNSGLLVSHIDSFEKYQNEKAWTWEHQALVRSRVICADPSLAAKFKEVRKKIIEKPRDTLTLKAQVSEMREKMRNHLLQNTHDKIDLKQASGGIVDVEFLVQFWVLANAHKYPQLSIWSDNLRLLDTLHDVGVIEEKEMAQLHSAYLNLRHSAHRLQLANLKFARKGKRLTSAMNDVHEQYSKVFGSSLVSD